jgi:thiol-disulfide isomerase/thioredoxin
MNAIYGVEHKDAVTFNRERGFPEKIVSENRQTYGFNGTGTGTTEFVEEQTRPAAWCRAFADEAERYFASHEAYEKTTRRRDLSPGELKTALEESAADLKKLGESLETPELKKLVDEQLAGHEQSAKYFIEEAEKRLAILGQPSEEWATTDLEGKTHALTDYRGKVVILDFWYRGCGWCIRAMPQMKEVAAHFEGQPVVVFGMNTDRDEKDALFVVEKMGLQYANLKATGLPEKYKVNGFPTLIILDQEGMIRDIHVGYSPTLREEVVRSVEQLLKPKP